MASQRKITPIISIEQKTLGLTRGEWIVLFAPQFVAAYANVFVSSISIRIVAFFISLMILMLKRSYEKKEQDFFSVWMANKKLPFVIHGTFSRLNMIFRKDAEEYEVKFSDNQSEGTQSFKD